MESLFLLTICTLHTAHVYIHSTEFEGGDYNRIGAILLDLELIDGVKSIGYLIRDSIFFCRR